MSDDKDLRIADLLRADAPPPRDPVFRIKVLERREQQRFQRRLYIMLAGALLMVLISVLALSIGGGTLQRMGVPIAGAALASACLAFRRNLPQIFRRFSL
jgi:hypothetical protein